MHDIFAALKERHLCDELADFETQWLGVSRRYLLCYGAPSVKPCLRLYVRLVNSGPQQGDLAELV